MPSGRYFLYLCRGIFAGCLYPAEGRANARAEARQRMPPGCAAAAGPCRSHLAGQ